MDHNVKSELIMGLCHKQKILDFLPSHMSYRISNIFFSSTIKPQSDFVNSSRK